MCGALWVPPARLRAPQAAVGKAYVGIGFLVVQLMAFNVLILEGEWLLCLVVISLIVTIHSVSGLLF